MFAKKNVLPRKRNRIIGGKLDHWHRQCHMWQCHMVAAVKTAFGLFNQLVTYNNIITFNLQNATYNSHLVF